MSSANPHSNIITSPHMLHNQPIDPLLHVVPQFQDDGGNINNTTHQPHFQLTHPSIRAVHQHCQSMSPSDDHYTKFYSEFQYFSRKVLYHW